MTLQEIFENDEYLNFRDKVLSESDKEYFINRLNENGIYDVLPFLSVVKSISIELLEPIMREIIKYNDVSAPKKYMDTICRLFTPEKTLDVLLEMISGEESYKTKCKAAGILYCTGVILFSNGIDEKGDIQWKCGTEFIWNGKRYELKSVEGNLDEFVQRRNLFYKRRTTVLVEQFLKNENIVFRFYLKRYLPLDIKEYPFEIMTKAEEVISIISSEKFPNGLKQMEKLKKAVEGNLALEKLLFEELNWQRK